MSVDKVSGLIRDKKVCVSDAIESQTSQKAIRRTTVHYTSRTTGVPTGIVTRAPLART